MTKKQQMTPFDKLTEHKLILPEAPAPGGNYVSVNIRGNIAYVAIQFPISDAKFMFQGRLGNELTTTDGCKAMELCALNVLAQIDKKVGFNKLIGLNHIDIYFRSEGNWDDSPKVADGASNLFVSILGDRGRHSRALFGVENLPRNFSVGLTATFTIEIGGWHYRPSIQ